LNSNINTDLILSADSCQQKGGEAREQPEVAAQILRFEGTRITLIWFKNRDKELHLTVKPYKNGCRCPGCGQRGQIVRHTTEFRRW